MSPLLLKGMENTQLWPCKRNYHTFVKCDIINKLLERECNSPSWVWDLVESVTPWVLIPVQKFYWCKLWLESFRDSSVKMFSIQGINNPPELKLPLWHIYTLIHISLVTLSPNQRHIALCCSENYEICSRRHTLKIWQNNPNLCHICIRRDQRRDVLSRK